MSAAATPSRKRILVSSACALLVAALVLVAFVLPAEYGIDPLRTGRLLGLTALANVQPTAIAAQNARFRSDTRNFVLGPYQTIEFKYRLEKGGTMLYAWRATGPVTYDFHSEPDGAPEGYAESFDRADGEERYGTYTAPFSGIHGWFWENSSMREVRIKLVTSGFYTAAKEFFDNGSADHEIKDVDPFKAPPAREE